MKGEMNRNMKRDICDRTFQFALRIVKLCRFLDEKPGINRTLSNQLLRSGTSIGANVEEGQAAQSEADFLTKMSIACKEARETHYWIRLLKASELVESNKLEGLEQEANELVAILSTICKKVKEKRK